MHKLTEADIRAIRKMAFSGRYKAQDIADKFGIHKAYVRQIKYKRVWKHLRD